MQFLMNAIENSLKAFLANPSYPSAPPHKEEDGKTYGEVSRTRDVLPCDSAMPCDSATNSAPKALPSLMPHM